MDFLFLCTLFAALGMAGGFWLGISLQRKSKAPTPLQQALCAERMAAYRVDTSKAVNDAYQSGFIAGRKERELSTK